MELGLDCTDEELGATARRVLGGSRDGVAHPSDWADWGRVLEPLLAAAGVRSWSNFAKTATCIELEEKDGALFLVPTVNLGAADGFEPQDALKLECTMGEDGAAGAAIKRLLR